MAHYADSPLLCLLCLGTHPSYPSFLAQLHGTSLYECSTVLIDQSSHTGHLGRFQSLISETVCNE